MDKLLDAAGRAFADIGVASATMVDVARLAGCSRATLYRYFPNQDALRLAFVHRATWRIAQEMADGRRAGASGSLTDRILTGIAAVRSDPQLAVWFEPQNMSVPIGLSQNSELLRAMATGLVGGRAVSTDDQREIERRGEWLLRSIVSLLAMPGEDAETERFMVEQYLVPVLLADFPHTEVSQ